MMVVERRVSAFRVLTTNIYRTREVVAGALRPPQAKS